jgi:hypothetical protein
VEKFNIKAKIYKEYCIVANITYANFFPSSTQEGTLGKLKSSVGRFVYFGF